ncbi:hypothetical protein [Rhodococcus chondri]|uniref:Uncharacterized protein n=1 Tax=Rhodococcus chondri TaxID=3065941 RepID=A0ABU7JLL1_9NOCA|nr:hypothetical protein [Rhodococcus sp. CC-R104]MEE2030931.1 hypothetical protein [Rhodococcus sp. CC-R104]
MRKFHVDTISTEGPELDESRLAQIVGGKAVNRDDREKTGCIPDLGGSIRADDPTLG